jgi:hypothetical protein
MEISGVEAWRRPGNVRWSSQDTPVNVRLVIARDEAMRNVVYSQANASRNLAMPRLSPGEYYWTVQASNAEGIDISAVPSRFRVLPIPLLPAPRNTLPANAAVIGSAELTDSRNIVFSWSNVQDANGYILTIFKGSGITRSTVKQTEVLRETRYTEEVTLLGSGNFYWQVEAVYVADNGSIEQRGVLQENTLTIDDLPLLPVPINMLPVNAAVIGPEQIRASRSVVFSWGYVQGANGYILTVFQDSGAERKTVVSTEVLRDTSYTLADIRELGRGNFYWQVEAVYVAGDSFEQRGQIQENRLTVDIPSPAPINTRDTGVLYGH